MASFVFLSGASTGTLIVGSFDRPEDVTQQRNDLIVLASALLVSSFLLTIPAVIATDVCDDKRMILKSIDVAKNSNEGRIIVSFPQGFRK